MPENRKYLVVYNRRDFHMSNSTLQMCTPSKSDTVAYSDSMESLIRQGLMPCRWCLPDVTLEKMNEIMEKSVIHQLNEVG